MSNISCPTQLKLSELVGRGGMSEVFRAQWAGADGFERPVAVKRILPETFDDPNALGLFKAELQLCSMLQHPNIVQVFQCGVDNGAPFLVMEYLDGVNLMVLSQKLASTNLFGKKGLTVLVACHIISEVAKGLGYAHRFRDPFNGKPLDVVHRDISPDNIFLTYSDGIKLVDFGIAKFAGRAELTQALGVRGKVRYLSPEQAQASVHGAPARVGLQ